MAFQSWTCALTGEPIPSCFLDSDHGHLTLFFPGNRALRGFYSGYGVVLEAEVLRVDDSIQPTGEPIPDAWRNDAGEVCAFHAWVDATCDMTYAQLMAEGLDPQSMALQEAKVVKTRNLADASLQPSYPNLPTSSPCPYHGIFYGASDTYSRPITGLQNRQPQDYTNFSQLDDEALNSPEHTSPAPGDQ